MSPCLASAPAVRPLLARLSHHAAFTTANLAELRQLLATYPPQAIARCLEAACDQLVQEGQAPDFPDTGEMDAYLELLLGLRQLAQSRPPVALSRQLA